MSAIGPGDWVEFVGRPNGYVSREGPSWYTLGALYLVISVGHRCEDAAGNIWNSCKTAGTPEFAPSGRRTSTPVACFRPIYRPKADFLEGLLTPADAPSEREGVEA